VKARIANLTDIRPANALAVLSIVALAAMSTPADARYCGVMKKAPAYWAMPMHQPMPYGNYNAAPRGPRSGIPMKAGPSVIEVAKRAGEFGTLLTAMEAAGLTGLLEGDGPYTLFAPTDAAFKKLPDGALQELLGDKDKLTAILKQHVVPGRTTALEILESRELKTASGQELQTADLSVVRADIPARNGIIHVVDKVLLPAN